MRIDRDTLTIVNCFVVLAGFGVFILYHSFGVNLYVAIPAAIVFIDGPVALGCWALLKVSSRQYEPIARMVDPVFGEIEFYKGGSWQADVDFDPLKERMLVFIDAAESGPSEQQRELFREIILRYADLRPQIDAALAQHYQEYLKAFESVEMPNFSPSICIPRSEISTEWSIDFSTDPEDYLSHTVVFRDWEIVDVYSGD